MKSLKDFRDQLTRELFGETKEQAIERGVCICCKKPPTFYSQAGKREYRISGLCEPCFDQLCESDHYVL